MKILSLVLAVLFSFNASLHANEVQESSEPKPVQDLIKKGLLELDGDGSLKINPETKCLLDSFEDAGVVSQEDIIYCTICV